MDVGFTHVASESMEDGKSSIASQKRRQSSESVAYYQEKWCAHLTVGTEATCNIETTMKEHT